MLHVKILSPLGELGSYHCSQTQVPAWNGEMAVAPGFTPFVGAMSLGVVRLHGGGSAAPQCFFVPGGFFEVKEGVLTLLVEDWEEASSIDFERAAKSRQRALERLAAVTDHSVNIPRALKSLKRAELRLSLQDALKAFAPASAKEGGGSVTVRDSQEDVAAGDGKKQVVNM